MVRCISSLFPVLLWSQAVSISSSYGPIHGVSVTSGTLDISLDKLDSNVLNASRTSLDMFGLNTSELLETTHDDACKAEVDLPVPDSPSNAEDSQSAFVSFWSRYGKVIALWRTNDRNIVGSDDKTPWLHLIEAPHVLHGVLLKWLEVLDPHSFLRSHLPLLLGVLAIWLVSGASLLYRHAACRELLVAAYRLATAPSDFPAIPLLLLALGAVVMHDSFVRLYYKYDFYIDAATRGFAGMCLGFAGVSTPKMKIIRVRTSLSCLEAIAGGLSVAIACRLVEQLMLVSEQLGDSSLADDIARIVNIARVVVGIGALLVVHGFGTLAGVPFLSYAAQGIGKLLVGITHLFLETLRVIRQQLPALMVYSCKCVCFLLSQLIRPIRTCSHKVVDFASMVSCCIARAVKFTARGVRHVLERLYFHLFKPPVVLMCNVCTIAVTRLWSLVSYVGTCIWKTLCDVAIRLWALLSRVASSLWKFARGGADRMCLLLAAVAAWLLSCFTSIWFGLCLLTACSWDYACDVATRSRLLLSPVAACLRNFARDGATRLWLLLVVATTCLWYYACDVTTRGWLLLSRVAACLWNFTRDGATRLWLLLAIVTTCLWDYACDVTTRGWLLLSRVAACLWNFTRDGAARLWMLLSRVTTCLWDFVCDVAARLWISASHAGAWLWDLLRQIFRICYNCSRHHLRTIAGLVHHVLVRGYNILRSVWFRVSDVIILFGTQIYAVLQQVLSSVRRAVDVIGGRIYDLIRRFFGELCEMVDAILSFSWLQCTCLAGFICRSALWLYRNHVVSTVRTVRQAISMLWQQLWIICPILMRFFSPAGCFLSSALFSYHLLARLVYEEAVPVAARFSYACAAFETFSVGTILLGRSLNRSRRSHHIWIGRHFEIDFTYAITLGAEIEAWGTWLFLNSDFWILRAMCKHLRFFVTETSASILNVVTHIAVALRWGAGQVEEFLDGLVKALWSIVCSVWRAVIYPTIKFIQTFGWSTLMMVWNNPLLFLLSSVAVVAYAYFVHIGTLQPPDSLKVNMIFCTCMQLLVVIASKSFNLAMWFFGVAWYIFSIAGSFVSGGFASFAPWLNAVKGSTTRLAYTLSHRPLEMFADSSFAALHATITMAASRCAVLAIHKCQRLSSREVVELTTRLARTSQRMLFIPLLLSSVMYGVPSTIALRLLQVASMPLALIYIITSVAVVIGEVRVWQVTSIEQLRWRRRDGQDPIPEINTDLPVPATVFADDGSDCSICLCRLYPEKVKPLESCVIHVDLVNGPRDCLKGSFAPNQIAIELQSLMRGPHVLDGAILSEYTARGKWRLRVSIGGIYQVRVIDRVGNEILEKFRIRVAKPDDETFHCVSTDMVLHLDDERPSVRQFQGLQRADSSGDSELRFRAMALGTHGEDEPCNELVVDVLRIEGMTFLRDEIPSVASSQQSQQSHEVLQVAEPTRRTAHRYDFGPSFAPRWCKVCATMTRNRGCRECSIILCHLHFASHQCSQACNELTVDVSRDERITGRERPSRGTAPGGFNGMPTQSATLRPYVTISCGGHVAWTAAQPCNSSAVFDQELLLPCDLRNQNLVNIQMLDSGGALTSSIDHPLIGDGQIQQDVFIEGEEKKIAILREGTKRCTLVLRMRSRAVAPEVNAELQLVPQQVDGCHTSRCGHVFHEKCITSWMRTRAGDRCPVCREALGRSAASILQRVV